MNVGGRGARAEGLCNRRVNGCRNPYVVTLDSSVKFKNPRKLDCCSLLDRFFYSTDDSHEGDRVERSLFYSSKT